MELNFEKKKNKQIGNDPFHGVTVVSLLKQEENARILIRTKYRDFNIVLPELNSHEKILQNMKSLTEIDYRLIPESDPYLQLLKKVEQRIAVRDFRFDVLYVPYGQYLLSDILRNRERNHSRVFDDFLTFLGNKVQNHHKVSSTASPMLEYSIQTNFRKLNLTFNISTFMVVFFFLIMNENNLLFFDRFLLKLAIW